MTWKNIGLLEILKLREMGDTGLTRACASWVYSVACVHVDAELYVIWIVRSLAVVGTGRLRDPCSDDAQGPSLLCMDAGRCACPLVCVGFCHRRRAQGCKQLT